MQISINLKVNWLMSRITNISFWLTYFEPISASIWGTSNKNHWVIFPHILFRRRFRIHLLFEFISPTFISNPMCNQNKLDDISIEGRHQNPAYQQNATTGRPSIYSSNYWPKCFRVFKPSHTPLAHFGKSLTFASVLPKVFARAFPISVFLRWISERTL